MFQEKGRAPPSFKSLTREVITNTQEGGYHLHFTSYWSGLLAWCMKMFSFYLCVCMFVCVHVCVCTWVCTFVQVCGAQRATSSHFPHCFWVRVSEWPGAHRKGRELLVGRFPGSNPGFQDDGATNLPTHGILPALFFVRLLCIIIYNTIVKGDRH